MKCLYVLLLSVWTIFIAADHTALISDEYFALAQNLEREGKKDRALDYYKKAVEIESNHFNANVKLAELYFDQQLFDQAITCYEKAVQSKKEDTHLHFNLGLSYEKNENWKKAAEQFEIVYKLDPDHERAPLHLGSAQEKLGNIEDAIALYKKLIEKDPNSLEAYRYLGNAYRTIERLEDALDPFLKAAQLKPRNIHVLMDVANVYNMLDHCQEALEYYQKIVNINPGIISALYNFGYTLKKMGNLDRALEVYDQVIAKKPDYAPARFSRSTIYLANGNYDQGWDEYEWRWQAYNETPEKYNRPLWEGEDVVGRTLVVYAEQGLGDTLQFVRYIKYIKEHLKNGKHINIIFECQQPLLTLLGNQPYIDKIISRKEQPLQCHYHIPLMSLPRVLKTRLHTIPNDIPYIEAAPDLVEQWKKKLSSDKNFKIGICWQGNSRYSTLSLRRAVASKSIELEQLKPLFDIPGVSIYSLQQIDGIDQIAHCSFEHKLKQFDNEFDKRYGSFMDTAAVMKNLDLVISIDTAVCHLAAALGVQTWILLPNPPDWRWLRDRTDSPWYPHNVTLFTQPKVGDWSGAILEVKRAVEQLITKPIVHKLFTPLPQKKITQTPERDLFHEQLVNMLD